MSTAVWRTKKVVKKANGAGYNANYFYCVYLVLSRFVGTDLQFSLSYDIDSKHDEKEWVIRDLWFHSWTHAEARASLFTQQTTSSSGIFLDFIMKNNSKTWDRGCVIDFLTRCFYCALHLFRQLHFELRICWRESVSCLRNWRTVIKCFFIT